MAPRPALGTCLRPARSSESAPASTQTTALTPLRPGCSPKITRVPRSGGGASLLAQLMLLLLLDSTCAAAVPRIINGDEAVPYSFPFMVALVQANQLDDMKQGQFCGGALVAERWVATAAHCLEGMKASKVAVLFYGHDLRESPPFEHECTETILLDDKSCHENYSDDTLQHDVCLLRLAAPPQCISSGVLSITQATAVLDIAATVAPAGTEVTIMGWGNMAKSGTNYPNLLQEAQIEIATQTICEEQYGSEFLPGMICGSVLGSIDSCQGDSGGPLVVQVDGRWVLVGIVSWGYGCATSTHHGVYASVSDYREWFSSVAPSLDTPPAPPASPRPPGSPPSPPSPPQLPPPSPPPSAPSGWLWVVTSGSEFCQVSNGGTCVTDGAGKYGPNEACTVVAAFNLIATASGRFQMEGGNCNKDKITINGVRYCGRDGPNGVTMAAGDEMTWSSNDRKERVGFEICAISAMPSAPPLPPPPSLPPAPSAPAGWLWVVTSGSEFCQVSNGGTCVTDGAGKYGPNEACTVVAAFNLIATASGRFQMEGGNCNKDKITINGVRYCGRDGPNGVTMAAGDEMTWSSNDRKERVGFEICATTE